MDRSRVRTALVGLVVAALIGVLAIELGLVVPPWVEDREGAAVTLVDGDTGDRLATVEVEVADTRKERYTGLSDHESLADGSGMLFVHDGEARRTYVMRRMDFPIDMIFVDAERRITAIHHARTPGPNEAGSDLRYSGRAKYVLEVPRGFANETGLSVGDRIDIDYGDETPTNASASERLDAAATDAWWPGESLRVDTPTAPSNLVRRAIG
ncbi:MAG: uncharacterized membrane protein (UPF0127 family) [Halobacteriales archaeon]|jgi:uncharacterized membrane protein (UPF0127 family)